jgi:hypothetical protein
MMLILLLHGNGNTCYNIINAFVSKVISLTVRADSVTSQRQSTDYLLRVSCGKARMQLCVLWSSLAFSSVRGPSQVVCLKESPLSWAVELEKEIATYFSCQCHDVTSIS